MDPKKQRLQGLLGLQAGPTAPPPLITQQQYKPAVTGPTFTAAVKTVARGGADLANKTIDNTAGAAFRAATIAGQSIRDIPQRLQQAFDPNDDQSEGANLTNINAKRYGFTKLFMDQLNDANPTLGANLQSGLNSSAKQGTSEAGHRTPEGVNRIVVDGKYGDSDVIRHEGLHDVYSTLTPKQTIDYDQIISRAIAATPDTTDKFEDGTSLVRPGINSWLRGRLSDYKDVPDQLTNVSSLPYSIANEIHSYVPEYYDNFDMKMPPELANYYANYYNTGGTASGVDRTSPVQRLLGKIFR